jgi:tetratricopeptide (TPR) repeat protein
LKSNFILYLATRGEKSGDEIFNKFKIRATPTVMVVDSDGSEIDWLVGYGPPPDKYLESLEKTVKGIDTFKSLSGRYAKEPKNVEVVFKLASKYDRRYDQEKALQLYKEVLAIDPEGKMGTTDYGKEKVTYTEYAEYSIGALSVFSGKMDPEPLKAFIGKYPEGKMLKAAYGQLSYYYGYRASKEEAAKFFEEYASKYPEDPIVLNSYVNRIIRDKGDIDKGIELAEKIKDILKYNPEPRYMKNLAELYMLKGDKEKAEEAFGKDFMEGRVSSLSYSLRDYADFWAKQKTNIESAEEMMELAVKLKSDSVYFKQSAAGMYVRLNKLEKAMEIYGPGFIKEHPDKSDDLNSYAWFWANQEKNLESALEAAKKSVELAPSQYNWDTLGLVCFKLKRYEEALKAEEKAIELAGKRVEAYEKRIEQIKKAMAEKEKK